MRRAQPLIARIVSCGSFCRRNGGAHEFCLLAWQLRCWPEWGCFSGNRNKKPTRKSPDVPGDFLVGFLFLLPEKQPHSGQHRSCQANKQNSWAPPLRRQNEPQLTMRAINGCARRIGRILNSATTVRAMDFEELHAARLVGFYRLASLANPVMGL